jgi:hypothetical protein
MAAGGAVVAVALRGASYQRWGASDEEVAMVLPGDELLPNADLTATRAVTIVGGADVVWPWIAQLGQGRAGFYSYDFLENLVGCDIHSADRIVPEWQTVDVGSEVKFFPGGGLRVAQVEAERALVLCGGVPIGQKPPLCESTWAFSLYGRPDGTTRLLVREHYASNKWWAPVLLGPTQLISSLMSRRMLLGIKARAERSIAVPATAASPNPVATSSAASASP